MISTSISPFREGLHGLVVQRHAFRESGCCYVASKDSPRSHVVPTGELVPLKKLIRLRTLRVDLYEFRFDEAQSGILRYMLEKYFTEVRNLEVQCLGCSGVLVVPVPASLRRLQLCQVRSSHVDFRLDLPAAIMMRQDSPRVVLRRHLQNLRSVDFFLQEDKCAKLVKGCLLQDVVPSVRRLCLPWFREDLLSVEPTTPLRHLFLRGVFLSVLKAVELVEAYPRLETLRCWDFVFSDAQESREEDDHEDDGVVVPSAAASVQSIVSETLRTLQSGSLSDVRAFFAFLQRVAVERLELILSADPDVFWDSFPPGSSFPSLKRLRLNREMLWCDLQDLKNHLMPNIEAIDYYGIPPSDERFSPLVSMEKDPWLEALSGFDGVVLSIPFQVEKKHEDAAVQTFREWCMAALERVVHSLVIQTTIRVKFPPEEEAPPRVTDVDDPAFYTQLEQSTDRYGAPANEVRLKIIEFGREFRSEAWLRGKDANILVLREFEYQVGDGHGAKMIGPGADTPRAARRWTV